MSDKELQELLTLGDALRLLREEGVQTSYSTLHRRVISGELPAQMLGQQWFIRRSDALEYASRI